MKLKNSRLELRKLGLVVTSDMPESKLKELVAKYPQLKKFTDEQKESATKGSK